MKIKLNNGYEIPAIGFGTWRTPAGDVAKASIKVALEAGYRHIDTAAMYGNEASIGEALKETDVPREEIFITSKLWNDKHSYEGAKEALADSLKNLDIDYIDLYLIHWPVPKVLKDNDAWKRANQETWRYLEEAVEQGLVRSIGVSNFMPHHLDSLLETAKIIPATNQIYLSPSDQQDDVVRHNTKHNILSQAYSPLGSGTILENEDLQAIADKYNKSIAQVAIRWSLQKGFNPLPKSVTPERIVSNLDVFDFELTDEDMNVIDSLKGIGKEASNPDEKDF